MTSVERVGDDEGLTDFGGGALTGDPWRVSYRIALDDGVRQDFTWDAIPEPERVDGRRGVAWRLVRGR